MKKLLVKNSLSGGAQSILTALLTFVTVPIFIKLLGIEAYGVFAVVSVLCNLNTFSNLGLNTSLIKFISEQGKVPESHYDIAVTVTILLIILLPLTIIAMTFSHVILNHLLNIPSYLIDDAQWLYIFLLIGNVFIILGQTMTAILDSQQRTYLTNFIQVIYSCGYWGLILMVLLLGYSMKMIGIAILVVSILWFAIVLITAFRIWGRLEVKGITSNALRIAKKQISYGIKIYSSGLVNFLYEPLTKILISNFLGVNEVGFFDIALRVRNQFWALIAKTLYPLFPFISQLADISKIRMIVHEVEQKTFIALTPVIVIIIYCSKSLTNLWIGNNVEVISIGIIFIVGSYLIGSATVIPIYQYLLAKDAAKTILLQGTNVLMNAFCFLLTYRWFGYYAAIIGVVVSTLSSFILCLYYQNKYLDSLIFDSFQQLMKVIILFSICCAVGYLLSNQLHSDWHKITIIPISISCVSIILYRLLKLFSKDDINRYTGEHKMINSIAMKILIKSN